MLTVAQGTDVYQRLDPGIFKMIFVIALILEVLGVGGLLSQPALLVIHVTKVRKITNEKQ